MEGRFRLFIAARLSPVFSPAHPSLLLLLLLVVVFAMEKIKEREGGRRRKGGRCLKHRSIKIRLSQILLPFSSLGSIDERGDDARYVDNNGDNDQANTRLRGFFFFFFSSPSLLSVSLSRVTLLVTVRLFCANFFLFLPPPLLSFFLFFLEKNISFNSPAGSLKRVARFYPPSRCAPSGSAPLEKTLNTLLRA